MPSAADTELNVQLAQTRLGPIEYAVVGAGFPVLVLHGSPGGIDAAELMSRFFPRDEIAALLVSRPGYLGTPLADRRTIDQQADLLAALLDELGVARAGVLSWSGGGPDGYRLAARHPDRVASLVAFAAVSKAYDPPKSGSATRLMFNTAAGQWLLRVLAAHRPKEYISGALDSEGSLTDEQLAQRVDEVFTDDAKREFVLAIGATASRGKNRGAGYDNDLEQFAAIESLDLESVTAPSLIIQGSVDTDVLPEQSEHAAATIPGAELLVMETGTHLGLYTHPDAAAVQARVTEFLLQR